MKELYTTRVKEFFLLNRKKWKLSEQRKLKVLIETISPIPSYLINASILGINIAKKNNCQPVFLLNDQKSEFCEQEVVCNSFGIYEKIIIKKSNIYGWNLFRAIFSVLILYTRCFSLKSFLLYSTYNIKVGDLFYDTFIRSKNRYKHFSIYNPIFIISTVKYFYTFWRLKNIIKKDNINSVILSHRVYLNGGLISRFANKNDIDVYIVRLTSIRKYTANDSIYQNEFRPSNDLIDLIKENELYLKIDDYLEKRFNGQIDQHDVINAFKNKQNLEKDLFKKLHKINNNKPIVTIFPHAFSDAPHCNEEMLFNDYYSFFKQTIKFANKITNVNWLVKPHPSSYMYGEVGEVEKMIKKYSNLNLLDSSVSTKTVLSFSENIITVSGTVGLEFSCLGKKPIIAGHSVYSGFNIALEPKNMISYKKILSNLTDSFELSPDELIIAKSVMYWYHIGAFPKSSFLPVKTALPNMDSDEIIAQKIEQIEEINYKLENGYEFNEQYFESQKAFVSKGSKYFKSF